MSEAVAKPEPPCPPLPLLCETCGYCIDGLPEAGTCPECGRSVHSSLPERRIGSAWQREQTAKAAWETWREVSRRPRAAFAAVRIESETSRRLRTGIGHRCGTWAALPLLAVATLLYALALASPNAHGLVPVALSVLVMGPVVWSTTALTFLALVGIEQWGVRLIGRRRGWRVTPTVAAAVCYHASPAWLVGARVWCAAWLLVLGFVALAPPMPGYEVQWILLLPFLGPLIGLVWFEVLVYIGIRQCRYANPPRRAAASRADAGPVGGTSGPVPSSAT